VQPASATGGNRCLGFRWELFGSSGRGESSQRREPLSSKMKQENPVLNCFRSKANRKTNDAKSHCPRCVQSTFLTLRLQSRACRTSAGVSTATD
jgi:hypothetical protein